MTLKEQLEKYRWNNMSKSCHEDDYIDGFNDCLELLYPLVEALEFYSDEKNWVHIAKDMNDELVSWKRKHIDDEELLLNYEWPCGARGTLRAGGRRSRQALQELREKLK